MTQAAANPVRLNLGCGRKKLAGFVNVDKSEAVAPDVLWDLDRFPYPLERGHFTEVRAFDVVEHLQDIPAFMDEVHALLAPGGTIEITTPHYSSPNSYNDPTHRFHFGLFAFDVFTRHELDYYAKGRFDLVQRKLYFEPSAIARLKFHLFNRYPRFYERRLAWLLPAWFMSFVLRKR
jgi:SAM-dependent methyltransferase